MSQVVNIQGRKPIDTEELVFEGTVSPNTSGSLLTLLNTGGTFKTLKSRAAFLSFVGNSVSSGGSAYITVRPLQGGSRLPPPYHGFTMAMGATYDGVSVNSLNIELSPGNTFSVSADNTDTVNSYLVTVRIRIDYYDK